MLQTHLPPRVVAPRPAPRRRYGRMVAVVVLGWLALTFLMRDPLHYLIDPTPESFGRYWPNRPWLLLHIVGGVAALMVGPFQFSTRIRTRYPALHRAMGRTYLLGVLVAGATAFYLAFFAPQASFGVALFVLATAWWITAGIAFAAILRRRITVHRRWMIRSYIVTFAFVTFRLLGTLPLWAPFGVHGEAVAGWVAWVVPMLAFELYLRRVTLSSR